MKDVEYFAYEIINRTSFEKDIPSITHRDLFLFKIITKRNLFSLLIYQFIKVLKFPWIMQHQKRDQIFQTALNMIFFISYNIRSQYYAGKKRYFIVSVWRLYENFNERVHSYFVFNWRCFKSHNINWFLRLAFSISFSRSNCSYCFKSNRCFCWLWCFFKSLNCPCRFGSDSLNKIKQNFPHL